jgi:hypothetical protein
MSDPYKKRKVKINGRDFEVSGDPDKKARALAAMKFLDDQALAHATGPKVTNEEFVRATREKRIPKGIQVARRD